MINLLGLLMQAFFDHQARTQADRLREAGIRAAEKGRRVALAVVFYALSGAFFFSALLIGLIDLGLQIDRGNGVAFSGLMVSSSLLIVIGLICVLIAWLIGRDPATVAAPTPEPHRSSELRGSLEELAVIFIKDFTQSQREMREKAKAQEQSQNQGPV